VSQHKIQKFILIKTITTSATMEILAATSSLYQENCVVNHKGNPLQVYCSSSSV